MKGSRTEWIYGLATGLAFALSWPPFKLFPVQLICLVPLLLVAKGKVAGVPTSTFFLLSMTALFTGALGTLYWLAAASPASLVVSAFLFALTGSFVLVAWRLLDQRLISGLFSQFLSGTFLITAWLWTEQLKELLNFPWLNLGMSLANYPSLVQYYEYTGPAGGTAYLLLAGWLFSELIIKASEIRRKKAFIFHAVFGLIACLPLAWSIWRYNTFHEAESPVEVRTVQLGKSYFSKKAPYRNGTDELIRLSTDKTPLNTEYFVWPEGTLAPGEYLNEDSLETAPLIGRLKTFLKPYRHASLVAGALTYSAGHPRQEDTLWYNSALCIEEGRAVQIYHKRRLVPGFEKPFVGFSLTAGACVNNFYARSGLGAAPAICFESAFTEDAAEKIAAGAQFMVVMTNDAWWGRNSGSYQHLDYARLLAISVRRCIARSALGGISCVINQRGDLVKVEYSEQSSSFQVALNASESITYFTAHPHVILYFFTSLLVIIAIGTVLSPNKRQAT